MFTRVRFHVRVFSVLARLTVSITITLMLSSCATVLKGYYSSVDILNAPDSVLVTTSDGVPITVQQRARQVLIRDSVVSSVSWVGVQKLTPRIQLRSNKDYVLVLRRGQVEKRVEVSPKLGAGWLLLNILFGGVPAIIDMYTGNWNFFDPIDFQSAGEVVGSESK